MELAFLIALFVIPGTVTALKHRWLLFGAGLLFGPLLWGVGLVLPARPRSWWYLHVYSEQKRARVDHELARVERLPPAEALARIFRRR